ncbi:hypothetical protein HYV71_01835 [Candidatus Uhrbacteria bacterium]|nr:hypothetical protein [Candidatus Uhrbacteria bacterium]
MANQFESALRLARAKVKDDHPGKLRLLAKCEGLLSEYDSDDAYHRGLDKALARGDFPSAGLYFSKIQQQS